MLRKQLTLLVGHAFALLLITCAFVEVTYRPGRLQRCCLYHEKHWVAHFYFFVGKPEESGKLLAVRDVAWQNIPDFPRTINLRACEN